MASLELHGEGMSRFGVSMEDGTAELPYILVGETENTYPTVDQINRSIEVVLGGVTNLKTNVLSWGAANGGRVDRRLPLTHPIRPELSAVGMDFVGTGRASPASSYKVGLPVSDQFNNYVGYEFKVRFQKRPFPLVKNEDIPIKTDLHYWPPDGSSGTPIRYAEEWRRFTTLTRTPSPDTVSAEDGAIVFRTGSGGEPNNRPYTGQPFQFLQNELIEVDWFLVPYRYFQEYETHKPYLTRFVNCINQHDWWGFPAGSLMYLGATPKSFFPVTPDKKLYQKGLESGADSSLLCNVKLRFLYTSRVGTDVPGPGHALLTNKNHIAAGHNLVPNFTGRQFSYCVANDDPLTSDANRKPLLDSFPFQLLFTDPLLSQQGGAI